MRVIAGIYRKRKLIAPPGTDIVRPTSDRVKESLFNILAHRLEQSTVLDLFAGSGALGIESLSRGAKFVHFVEKHPQAIQALRENLNALKVPPEHYKIHRISVEDFLSPRFLEHAGIDKASIDLILADPPYLSPWYTEAIQSIQNSGIAASECLVVFEAPLRIENEPVAEPFGWQLIDERRYGSTKLYFYSKAP